MKLFIRAQERNHVRFIHLSIWLVLLGVMARSVGLAACAPPPPGLLAWWPGNGSALDAAGTNHGVLLNGAGFASGLVQDAFSFSALDHTVRIPDATALNPTNGMTLEGWVWVSQFPGNDGVVIAGKDAPWQQRQYLIALNQAGSRWTFRAHVGVASGLKYFDGATSVRTGAWHHVAMTHDNVTLRLYVNGVLDGSLAAAGPMLPTANPMNIGGFGVAPWTLLGRVDELSLYGRALTSDEIRFIFAAGESGKCDPTNLPPVARIVVSPLTQFFDLTNKVVLTEICGHGTVVLDGSTSSDAENDPLTYEWTEGTNRLGSAVLITNELTIGTHEITLTVRDRQGSGTATETVEVVSPAQAVAFLIGYVEGSDLGRRNLRPLIASLVAAAASLERCDTIPAANQLQAFQNKVRAQVAPQDPTLAEKLIAATQVLIGAIETGTP